MKTKWFACSILSISIFLYPTDYLKLYIWYYIYENMNVIGLSVIAGKQYKIKVYIENVKNIQKKKKFIKEFEKHVQNHTHSI